MERAKVIGIIALALLGAACDAHVERNAHAGVEGAAPKTAVAKPVLAKASEWTDHTGRAEAVDSVEIRARATGHLQKVLFKDGDLVKRGDLLFVVDPRPYNAALNRARADFERAKIDQDLAQREASRADALFKSDVIAERERDTQSTALLQLGARSKVAGTAVSSAELDLEYAYVRAPISGRIGRALVTAGNLVAPTMPSPLTTLVSTDPLYVYVDVDESTALRIAHDVSQKGGDPPAAEVGFADEAGHPHAAVIDFVDNRVDPQTGTLKVRVVVKNDSGGLRPGLFARVRLGAGAAHDMVLIADRTIGTDQDRRFVYVVDGDDKVQRRFVKLGPLHDGLRVVRDGVTPADRIVVVGLQRVQPGLKIAPELGPMLAVAPSSDGTAK